MDNSLFAELTRKEEASLSGGSGVIILPAPPRPPRSPRSPRLGVGSGASVTNEGSAILNDATAIGGSAGRGSATSGNITD